MNILRKLSLVLLAAILPFLLLILAFDYWVINTVSHPATVKKIIADSGAYTNLIPSALDQASNNSGGSGSVSLSDPAVKSAAEQVFSPQFLRQSTENILDGVYNWLDGKVPQPDFRIDLSGKKADFAALVAAHASQVASGLPRCSLAQSEALSRQGNDFDVFGAKCLPPATTPASVSADIKKNLSSNKDFLKDPVITAGSLKDKKANRSVFEDQKIKKLPSFYQSAKKTPFVISFLVLLILIGILFLSSSRRRGFRRIGIALLVVGLIMLIFAYGVGRIDTNRLVPDKNSLSNQTVVEDARRAARDVLGLLRGNYWFFGGLYAALGAAAILASVYWKRRPQPAEADHQHEDPAPAVDKPQETTSKPEKPKSKPRKIKVQ